MVRIWKRHMTIVDAIVKDGTGQVKAAWFNQPYLASTFKKGTMVCLAGKLAEKRGAKYLSNPMYEKVRDAGGGEDDYTHTGRLVPVYPETAGVTSRWLRYIIKPLLGQAAKSPILCREPFWKRMILCRSKKQSNKSTFRIPKRKRQWPASGLRLKNFFSSSWRFCASACASTGKPRAPFF